MRQFTRLRWTLLSGAILAAHAGAQGSDDCGTATPISGSGTFAVSTVGSTDSPQQAGSCPTAHHDVWFAWTATATQSMSLTSCGGTSADTVLAVYPGSSCPSAGTELACNDDSCGQQSQVYFNAVSGSTYLFQIGAWGATATFSGTFSVMPGSSPCGTGVGPDVIVGDITDVANYVAANGLDAFTIGSTSCNIGTAVVNWWGTTNQHPVISETFYKYKVVDGSGRFEQIGMSWLKHGFAADTGSHCCSCQDPNNSQLLGVGCSDPYSASQAGSQSNLAPRWQVNPHTGVFPFPGANPGYSGTTARRCETALSDLEPSSASVRFYVECTYTTADDAAAGNNNNNASTEAMTVTGGPSNYTFATTGGVQPMWSAIRNWPLLEPGVTLTDVQVPSDGLFVIGSRATDLGSGQYHYEYAVHNMNVQRACGSFSVPLPAGAIVTNIGFHDVTYRNGDGVGNVDQTSTDWTSVVSAGTITWSSQTQAQDPNANAIRWGCTYNFRFDANVAPASGSVSAGLWEAGTPAAVAAAAEVPGGNAPIVSFCAGDGSGAACPCGNSGAGGRGCENSSSTGGALLAGTGNPSLGADTFLLTASDERPIALTIFWQGSTETAGSSFGDGIGCFSNPGLRRLYFRDAVGGAAAAPQGAELSVSARSAAAGDSLSAGDTRIYHTFYRDGAASFCPPPQGSSFNTSNGLRVIWGP